MIRHPVQLELSAWQQTVAALEDGSAIGRLVVPRLDARQGFLIASLDSTVQPAKILTQLRTGGVSRRLGSAASAMQWLANETSRFVSAEAEACCVIENRYARDGDASLDRFTRSPAVLATGDVVHVLSGLTSAQVVFDVLRKTATLPHTAIFWSHQRSAQQSPIDEVDIASRCERVFVWVCDGEAYLELRARL